MKAQCANCGNHVSTVCKLRKFTPTSKNFVKNNGFSNKLHYILVSRNNCQVRQKLLFFHTAVCILQHKFREIIFSWLNHDVRNKFHKIFFKLFFHTVQLTSVAEVDSNDHLCKWLPWDLRPVQRLCRIGTLFGDCYVFF